LDVTSRRQIATAAPISTFKIQYAEEGLTVSKYAHRVVKLSHLRDSDGQQRNASSMSLTGTFETSCDVRSVVANGRKADVARTVQFGRE
jgi:hypothetical protein